MEEEKIQLTIKIKIMKEQFIPYELALELKELGFNEPCFACYLTDKFLNVEYTKKQFHFHGQVASAPLWQQVFDFFREKGYNAYIEVTDTSKHYYWSITVQDSNDREYNDVDLIDSVNNRWYSSLRFENYDNARIEAIKIIIDLYKKYLDR